MAAPHRIDGAVNTIMASTIMLLSIKKLFRAFFDAKALRTITRWDIILNATHSKAIHSSLWQHSWSQTIFSVILILRNFFQPINRYFLIHEFKMSRARTRAPRRGDGLGRRTPEWKSGEVARTDESLITFGVSCNPAASWMAGSSTVRLLSPRNQMPEAVFLWAEAFLCDSTIPPARWIEFPIFGLWPC